MYSSDVTENAVKTKTMVSRALLTRKTKLNRKMKYFRHGFTELLSLLLPGAILKVKNILMCLNPYIHTHARSQILKQTLYGVYSTHTEYRLLECSCHFHHEINFSVFARVSVFKTVFFCYYTHSVIVTQMAQTPTHTRVLLIRI